MNTFNTTQSIGDIVTIMPKASEVFKKYNIDFCCGGNRPLAEAITEQKLNEKEVLNDLEKEHNLVAKLNSSQDFSKMSAGNLSDYIVNTHHVFLKKALPELGELTATILRVHGPNHKNLFLVHKLFHSLKTDLEQHLIKEEEILFPLIKENEARPSIELLGKINDEMTGTEEEHEAAGNVLKELRKVTDNYTVPDDGCHTFHLTYKKLQELEADLFEHIHLENNILFKKHKS